MKAGFQTTFVVSNLSFLLQTWERWSSHWTLTCWASSCRLPETEMPWPLLLSLSTSSARREGVLADKQETISHRLYLVTHTTLIQSCEDSYLEIGWRGRWLLRQSVAQEHTQDIGLVLLCVSMRVWRKGGVGVCPRMWMYVYFKKSLETCTLSSSCPLSLDHLQWWGTHGQTDLSAHSA